METGENNTSTTPPVVTPAPGAATSTQEKNTFMAVLAYVGILIIIPFLVAKDNAFVKFHLKQGLVLFIIEIGVWIATMYFFWELYDILRFINLAMIVFSIIGIVNVLQGKEKELPLLGQFGRRFNI